MSIVRSNTSKGWPAYSFLFTPFVLSFDISEIPKISQPESRDDWLILSKETAMSTESRLLTREKSGKENKLYVSSSSRTNNSAALRITEQISTRRFSTTDTASISRGIYGKRNSRLTEMYEWMNYGLWGRISGTNCPVLISRPVFVELILPCLYLPSRKGNILLWSYQWATIKGLWERNKARCEEYNFIINHLINMQVP